MRLILWPCFYDASYGFTATEIGFADVSMTPEVNLFLRCRILRQSASDDVRKVRGMDFLCRRA